MRVLEVLAAHSNPSLVAGPTGQDPDGSSGSRIAALITSLGRERHPRRLLAEATTTSRFLILGHSNIQRPQDSLGSSPGLPDSNQGRLSQKSSLMIS